jgi:hypothetical protein
MPEKNQLHPPTLACGQIEIGKDANLKNMIGIGNNMILAFVNACFNKLNSSILTA